MHDSLTAELKTSKAWKLFWISSKGEVEAAEPACMKIRARRQAAASWTFIFQNEYIVASVICIICSKHSVYELIVPSRSIDFIPSIMIKRFGVVFNEGCNIGLISSFMHVLIDGCYAITAGSIYFVLGRRMEWKQLHKPASHAQYTL